MSKPRQRTNYPDNPRLQEELKNIYELRNRLEVVTTEPNGSRTGVYGDVLIFNDSGTYKLRVSKGTTVWVGVNLS